MSFLGALLAPCSSLSVEPDATLQVGRRKIEINADVSFPLSNSVITPLGSISPYSHTNPTCSTMIRSKTILLIPTQIKECHFQANGVSRPFGPLGPISPYSPTYLPLYRPITFQPRLICSSCRWLQLKVAARLQECSTNWPKYYYNKDDILRNDTSQHKNCDC